MNIYFSAYPYVIQKYNPQKIGLSFSARLQPSDPVVGRTFNEDYKTLGLALFEDSILNGNLIAKGKIILSNKTYVKGANALRAEILIENSMAPGFLTAHTWLEARNCLLDKVWEALSRKDVDLKLLKPEHVYKDRPRKPKYALGTLTAKKGMVVENCGPIREINAEESLVLRNAVVAGDVTVTNLVSNSKNSEPLVLENVKIGGTLTLPIQGTLQLKNVQAKAIVVTSPSSGINFVPGQYLTNLGFDRQKQEILADTFQRERGGGKALQTLGLDNNCQVKAVKFELGNGEVVVPPQFNPRVYQDIKVTGGIKRREETTSLERTVLP
jgi:hypothetical protein